MSECHEIVVIIRPSFKKICGGDTCRTALFNHLLYWIAQKVKGEKRTNIPVEDTHWYGTAEEICAGMDDSWSVNKVRKEIKTLVDAGLIGQCHNPANNWDQTLHYFLGNEQGEVIRAACEKHNICLHCLGLTPDLLHLLFLVNAIDNEGKCKHQKSEIDLPSVVLPITKSGNAIPKDSTKVTSKASNKEEERGDSPQSTKPTSVQSIFSLEEQQMLDWYEKLKTGHKTKTEKAKEILPDLLKAVPTFEKIQSLHKFTEKKLVGKDDQTVYLATMRFYIPAWQKEEAAQTTQIEPKDPNKLVLGTRYRIYEDFPSTADLWFLFEMMPLQEVEQQLRMFNRDHVNDYQEHRIRERLDASDEATKRGLIDQWLNERMAIAV